MRVIAVSTVVTHVGGTTPLQLATSNNHIDCIRELILNGADYNAVDETGRTSLYIAASLGYEDAVLTHLRNAIGRDILSLPIRETGWVTFALTVTLTSVLHLCPHCHPHTPEYNIFVLTLTLTHLSITSLSSLSPSHT